jgi:hypothetical protein
VDNTGSNGMTFFLFWQSTRVYIYMTDIVKPLDLRIFISIDIGLSEQRLYVVI